MDAKSNHQRHLHLLLLPLALALLLSLVPSSRAWPRDLQSQSDVDADDAYADEYYADADEDRNGADYDDADDEEEESFDPSIQPQFTTEAMHVKVEPGHTIRLPCNVDNLGPMVLSWKSRPSDAPADAPYRYLTTGMHILTQDKRLHVEIDGQDDDSDGDDDDGGDDGGEQADGSTKQPAGSTLVITLAKEEDVGEYVCEVSSVPVATLRHHVSVIVAPTVKILRPENSVNYELPPANSDSGSGSDSRHSSRRRDEVKLYAGDELALVCHGTGDPKPRITWRRERKRMPDGRVSVNANQIIYKNVTRKHSGNYLCQGSNGPGKERTAKDQIRINVLHAPEIITEESLLQKDDSAQLELVCIVHASPRPEVFWYKDGRRLVSSLAGGDDTIGQSEDEDDVLRSERISIGHSGRKHLLVIRDVEEEDRGVYTCHARNNLGESKGNIRVMATVNLSPSDSRNYLPNLSNPGTKAEKSAPASPFADEDKTLQFRSRSVEADRSSGTASASASASSASDLAASSSTTTQSSSLLSFILDLIN